MTLPKNTRPLRTGELPPVGSCVYVPENTAALAGIQPTPGWRTVRATNSDNSTIAVRDADGYTSWVLSHNLLVEDEADTTTTSSTTITTTTHVTLTRPATAKQVADALTHVDGHHEVTVHTYPDRIEIEAHHEETQNRQ